MTATITSLPIGNADSTRLILADGQRLLLDFADMGKSEGSDIEFDLRAAIQDGLRVDNQSKLWELYTKVTSLLRIDFTVHRSGQRQRSSPCRCANPGRRVMFAPSAGRFSRAVALKLCC